MRTALVTGVAGQDGVYLARSLRAAGTTWGLGRSWERVPVVEEHPVLR